jgi:hypothetical protein
MYSLKQFKLVSGDEIICEIIDWPDDSHQVVVKNSMEICLLYNENAYHEKYGFRPWIHYLEGPTETAIINANTIVSVANPAEYLAVQYADAVKEMNSRSEFRDIQYDLEKAEKLNELAESLLRASRLPDDDYDDSDTSNVIKFPILH